MSYDDDEVFSDDVVLVIRWDFNGWVTYREWMSPEFAIAELAYNEGNGTLYARAKIIADDVDMGMWDRSP